MKGGLHKTRRHLPHWTLAGSTYFITFRTKEKRLAAEEQRLVLDHIKKGDGRYYTLIAATVMPDHVHVILRPEGEYTISRVMKGMKGASARCIKEMRKTLGSVWQGESFDMIIRNKIDLLTTANYVLENSLKAGLTDDSWNYPGFYCRSDIPI